MFYCMSDELEKKELWSHGFGFTSDAIIGTILGGSVITNGNYVYILSLRIEHTGVLVISIVLLCHPDQYGKGYGGS